MIYNLVVEELVIFCIVIIFIILFIMKVTDDGISIIVNNIKDMNQQKQVIQELSIKLKNIEETVNNNWIFLSEEVSDIYPAIKSLNIEIMSMKNKNE